MPRIETEIPRRKRRGARVLADPPCPNIDPMYLGYNGCYLACGGVGVGKTSIINDTIRNDPMGYRGKFDKVYLFTDSHTTDWGENVIETDDLTDEALNEIVDDEENKGLNICFIWDDVVHNLVKATETMRKFIRNRRHKFIKKTDDYTVVIEMDDGTEEEFELSLPAREPHGSLTIFITSQVYNEIPKKIRKLCDGVWMINPDTSEYDFFYNELLKPYVKKDKMWNFYKDVWDGGRVELYINKKTGKFYKNTGKIKNMSDYI